MQISKRLLTTDLKNDKNQIGFFNSTFSVLQTAFCNAHGMSANFLKSDQPVFMQPALKGRHPLNRNEVPV
jgi:hypothetical protein